MTSQFFEITSSSNFFDVVFTISELLRENQQGVKFPPLLPILGLSEETNESPQGISETLLKPLPLMSSSEKLKLR